MILDLLPYKRPQGPRKRIGYIRYIVFALSLVLVVVLFLIGKATPSVFFRLFIIGNIVYYVVGIALAVAFHDNRAFCKYICPITIFLKPMSRYSLLRIRYDEDKCIHCGKCLEVCPMDVEVTNDSRKRKNATECILCHNCTRACPVKALK
jgi:polyferredoxin